MRNRDEISRMLGTNTRQKSFYEAKNPYLESGGKISYLWGRARFALQKVRSEARIDEDVLALHRNWLGDLSDKKVLDLGCFSGNDLSLELARNSSSYLGIDLSKRAIESLNFDLREAGLYGSRTRAEAIDFLSPDFVETGFDVVYAKSVLHHFEHLGAMLEVLREKVAPGGVVVSWDPMQTSPPVWAARMLY
jgi:2-polyprenyl-3-methyl-5-hydroxy-6-metoxy-1,4-benzoquinol methylase